MDEILGTALIKAINWYIAKASSSLKTPTIPSFYKIITDNQSTNLVYNLVYRKDRGSRLERRGY